MNRIWASVIVISLLFAVCIVSGAINNDNKSDFVTEQCEYTDPELDLSQYTVDDLLAMSPKELNAFIADFERVYDPFGSYARRHRID